MSDLNEISEQISNLSKKVEERNGNEVSEDTCKARMNGLYTKLDGYQKVNETHFKNISEKVGSFDGTLDLKLQPIQTWTEDHTEAHKALSGRFWKIALILFTAIICVSGKFIYEYLKNGDHL